jgi:hypothetical protein
MGYGVSSKEGSAVFRNLFVLTALLMLGKTFAAEPAPTPASQAANLVRCYHEACARGNEALARELAIEAVRLDSKCFAARQAVTNDDRAKFEPRKAERRPFQWLRERIASLQFDPNARTEALIHQSEDLRQVRAEWQRIWFTDQASHLRPEQVQEFGSGAESASKESGPRAIVGSSSLPSPKK